MVHTEPVMGTVVSFHLHGNDRSDDELRSVVERACVRLHELDAMFSTWRPDSPVSRLRAGLIGEDCLPEEVCEVLELCREARRLSQGWFDPWSMPGGVDPTGLVKGWAVEQALAVLRRADVGAAVVNGGGDIAMHGEPPGGGRWRVGIQHPWRSGALACVIEAKDAVATSGCYERGAHLVDPRDGRRPTSTASATVVGSSLAFADAFATAIAVAGDEALDLIRPLAGYEAYLIRADGSEEATPGMVFV